MATMLNPNAISNGSITKEKIDAALLDGKQDTISDLDAIRQGAEKGSTALQTESDPIYTADKPNLALKSELDGKVDKEDGKVLSSNDYTDAEKAKLTELDEIIHGKIENIVLSPSAIGTYINPSGAGQIGTTFTANVPVDGSATSNCYKIAVKVGEKYSIYGIGLNEYVPLYLLTGNGNIVLDRKDKYNSRTNPVVLDITEDGYLYSNAWEPVSTDKIIKVTKVSEGLLADAAEINDEISGIKTSVEGLDKEIYGETSKTIILESTKDDYNKVMFNEVLPAGSVITSISRNIYNTNIYPIKTDGGYDASVTYDTIANNLPYTTDKDWIGLNINKVDTVTLVIGYDNIGVAKRVVNLEEDIDVIKTTIDGSKSITKTATSTKDEYNICLFDSPIPAGSIITSIDRSVFNMNMYMVKMDDSLDTSVSYDTLANNLPYTTTQEYKGASINKVGTLTLKIGEDVPSVDERLKKLETLRQSIFINREDTEIDVLNKMLLAFETGNVDVIFPDNAFYELNNVYEYMKQTLKWTWTLGLPIGNGCRYYGNGTTIKSTFIKAEHSDFASDAICIFDTKARGNNLEVYDFVLINNGGTYCIHDEGSNTTTPYFHKYSNLYLQCDTLTCFGCGVGFNASIFMQNCLFRANTANNNRNFLLHAPQNNPDNKKVNLYVKIDGCYFASDIPIGINPVGFDVSRDETILVISNSQYSKDLLEDTKSVIKDLIIYNNNL